MDALRAVRVHTYVQTKKQIHLEKEKREYVAMIKKLLQQKRVSKAQKQRSYMAEEVLRRERDGEIAKSLMALFHRPNRERMEGTKLQRTALHLWVAPD